MKRKPTSFLWALCFTLFASHSLLAHDEHCHTIDANGVKRDTKESLTEAQCLAKGKGYAWVHHHASCYETGPNGKRVAHPYLKTEANCTKRGYVWTGHAPETH